MSPVERSVPPRPGPVRSFDFPHVHRDALENELAVLSATHGDMPVVTAELVVDAGAAMEPAAEAGLAALVANAIETGTRGLPGDRVAWEFERLGVEFEADAGWDAASLRITVPRERLEPALELFAEVVRFPAFPEREVERLRGQQLAEILQRAKEPRALANDMAGRFIFHPGVPYARPLIGSSASVERLTRDDVHAFYRERFRPGSAALVLVGAIEPDDARSLAGHHFGDWPAGAAEEAEFQVLGAVQRTTIFIVDRPGSVQSEIRIGDVGAARHDPDYFAILVMNTILGGAFTSRLNLSLRERHGFTYGARSGFAFRRRPGPFVIQAAVATEVTAPAIREALREIESLRDDGASADDVAAARDYLAGILPLQLQTSEHVADRIAELFVYRLPDDYFRHYREALAAVSPDDVQRVARERLRSDRFAIVVVGDASRIAEELDRLGAGPVEIHKTD